MRQCPAQSRLSKSVGLTDVSSVLFNVSTEDYGLVGYKANISGQYICVFLAFKTFIHWHGECQKWREVNARSRVIQGCSIEVVCGRQRCWVQRGRASFSLLDSCQRSSSVISANECGSMNLAHCSLHICRHFFQNLTSIYMYIYISSVASTSFPFFAWLQSLGTLKHAAPFNTHLHLRKLKRGRNNHLQLVLFVSCF